MFTKSIVALGAVSLLAACATPPKDFYADPTKPKDTALCRAHLESQDSQFKTDTAVELTRRGLTLEECQNRVAMESAAVVGIAAVATGVAVAAACSGGGCTGYSAPYLPSSGDYDCWGGGGDGPNYVRGPIRLTGRDIYDLDRDGDGIGCEPYQDWGA